MLNDNVPIFVMLLENIFLKLSISRPEKKKYLAICNRSRTLFPFEKMAILAMYPV